METWRRRLMRLMLPFGIVWIAYGVLDLVTTAQLADPRPAALFSGVFAIVGGFIFVLNWWLYCDEAG